LIVSLWPRIPDQVRVAMLALATMSCREG
jgi:hypothetical protein